MVSDQSIPYLPYFHPWQLSILISMTIAMDESLGSKGGCLRISMLGSIAHMVLLHREDVIAVAP